MMRLIVTTDSSTAGAVRLAGLANVVIVVECRLVFGPLPSAAEFNAFFAPRNTRSSVRHWLDEIPPWYLGRWEDVGRRGLIELLSESDSAEFWIGPRPNAQLLLLSLLDLCSHESAAISKLMIRHLDSAVRGAEPERLAELIPPAVKPTQDHLELARRAWRAYRAPTPRAWNDLLSTDLSLFPQLERGVIDLLDELPNVTSGLGATETRILELIAPGKVRPFHVFPGDQKPNERRVYDYWEVGAVLDGLARSPVPAIAGLKTGPFTLDLHEDARLFARYKRSLMSLTDFGAAVLAGEEDFWRRNPIRRWWGGTELTNERLWRWDRESRSLVAP